MPFSKNMYIKKCKKNVKKEIEEEVNVISKVSDR